MNSLTTLRVTKENGVWAFTDERVGLHREPFVAGADTLCEMLAHSVGNTDALTIIFSANEFPTAKVKLDWVRPECGGNLYILKEMNHSVWLCPALLKYFDKAPKQIYVEVRK